MSLYLHDNNNTFFVIGISYKKADVSTRSRFSLSENCIKKLLSSSTQYGVVGSFCISTCNRTELYGITSSFENIYQLLSDHTTSASPIPRDILYTYEGDDAVRHLLSVASGLDSQILGDFEIINQIKKSFSLSQSAGTLNAFTDRLIGHAIHTSKSIKNNTKISDGLSSVSYAAVTYLKQNIKHIRSKKILLLGLGKIGVNTCSNLVKQFDDPKAHITLMNRDPARAKNVAERFGLTSVSIEHLQEEICNNDILIVATGADEPIILKDMLPKDKNLWILDLSVPFNVAKETENLSLVNRIDIDELSTVVEDSMKSRRKELPRAKAIVEEKFNEFKEWEASRIHSRTLDALKEKIRDISYQEIKVLEKKNGSSNQDINAKIGDSISKKITAKFAAYIKQHSGKKTDAHQVIKDVFHLDIHS